MDKYLKSDYLKRHSMASKVGYISKPHKVLKDERPIEVYVDTEKLPNGEINTYFSLFNQDVFVGNSIIFHHEIPHEAYTEIARAMIQELLDSSDFEDLDREANGMCACKDYEGTYKNCDECHLLGHKDGKGCMGPMYSIPTHKNFWECEKIFKEKYGEGSAYYEEYQKRLITKHLREIRLICEDNTNLSKETKKILKDFLKTI